MGSSAALVTSLCGALLQHYNVVNLKTKDTVKLNDDKTLIHNLSQVAHCLAQEKVYISICV